MRDPLPGRTAGVVDARKLTPGHLTLVNFGAGAGDDTHQRDLQRPLLGGVPPFWMSTGATVDPDLHKH